MTTQEAENLLSEGPAGRRARAITAWGLAAHRVENWVSSNSGCAWALPRGSWTSGAFGSRGARRRIPDVSGRRLIENRKGPLTFDLRLITGHEQGLILCCPARTQLPAGLGIALAISSAFRNRFKARAGSQKLAGDAPEVPQPPRNHSLGDEIRGRRPPPTRFSSKAASGHRGTGVWRVRERNHQAR